jgi:regulator of sigma E protease
MAIIQGAITILLFVFILFTLVVIHELGHFVVARLFGIRVQEFGIGFPPRAKIMRNRGETLYTLNWLPIGGFVRLEGEDGDSNDPRSFTVAGLPRKVAVLLAGVAMNLVLAFAIFTCIAWLAAPQGGLAFNTVAAGSPADLAGLRPGETILAIDGSTFDLFPGPQAGPQAIAALRARAGQTVTLRVRSADGIERDVSVTLRPPDQAATQGALGIRAAALTFSGAYAGRDPVAALGAGVAWTVSAFRLIVDGLGSLVSSIASNPTTAPPVSGPIGIAAQVGDVFWQLGPIFTLYLAGLLSANLALVNALPFPPLDGGRILVILLKSLLSRGGAVMRRAGVRGGQVSARTAVSVERLTYLVGFAFLFGFLLWITYFDIARQVGGGAP